MFDLKNIFEARLRDKGMIKQVTAAIVCDAFDKSLVQIFGQDILKEAKALSFKEGTLKIAVTSSVLAQEIQGSWGEFFKEESEIKRFSFQVKREV